MSRYKIYNNDCMLQFEQLIKEGTKFDLILTDIPQELTRNTWDMSLDLDKMWEYLLQLRKDKTTPIVLFSNQPYTSKLIMSNPKMFKYMKYWQKDRPSGFLNAKKQPLKDIEEIVVFYEKQCYYNPIMVEGKPNHSLGKSEGKRDFINNNYGNFKLVRREGNLKYPRQLMRYNRPHPPKHPTEKPIELLKDLIMTYSKENDNVLDFTAGIMSTGVACLHTNRNFVGIEMCTEYFEIGKQRLEEINDIDY